MTYYLNRRGQMDFFTDAMLSFVKDRLLIFEAESDGVNASCKIQRKDETEPATFTLSISEIKNASRLWDNYPQQLLKKRVIRLAIFEKFPRVREEMVQAAQRAGASEWRARQ